MRRSLPKVVLRSGRRRNIHSSARFSQLPASPFSPRHLLSIADLSSAELNSIVQRACEIKRIVKHGDTGNTGIGQMTGKSVAMIFGKRSTRTRVSTESAVAHLGGSSMFLGKDDIQLGVNESLYDTSRVISSMVSCMVARVGKHEEVASLAKYSSVPVINALSDMFHPMQALSDIMTIQELFTSLPGLKLAWIGDANNVLYDLIIACAKSGINVSIATPQRHPVNQEVLELAREQADLTKAIIEVGNDPQAAVADADIIVTDTWISMGQESERQAKMKAFAGFQVSTELASSGRAKENWKFMHCLPRHSEEVTDEIFYGPRSLVFAEAENRKWTMIAALEAFVVNSGKI